MFSRGESRRSLPAWLFCSLACCLAGCSADERLADFAQQNMQEQAAQNRRMAEQAIAVAEASRSLVAADAQARQELIAAQAARQQEFSAMQAELDRQRREVETFRRQAEEAAARNAFVGQALLGGALLLAALTPLLGVWWALRAVWSGRADEGALSEIVVSELASPQPRFLPAASASALPYRPLGEPSSSDGGQGPFGPTLAGPPAPSRDYSLFAQDCLLAKPRLRGGRAKPASPRWRRRRRRRYRRPDRRRRTRRRHAWLVSPTWGELTRPAAAKASPTASSAV